MVGGADGWLGEWGPRLTAEDPTLRQDLKPLGVSIQGVDRIYQHGKGDRLGWSGLLTLQFLSVFIELDARAFRPTAF